MKPALDPGATEEFGPYVVYERLGMGGMAVVHRAKKQGIAGYERKLALKRLLPQLAEDTEFVDSFIREAKVASLLVHPNIAQIYDFGRIERVYYIAMEHVDGFDVRKLLRFANTAGELIPLPVVLSILIELCDALDYAHRFADENGNPLGIVHRDVSPSNLIVAHTGHLKVIDFGIAKAESRQLHTSSGRVKGKLGYMSPEAAMGSSIGPVSDVFSAGVVAYELLTAAPLFSAKTDFETMIRIREAEILPPSHANPQVPIELDGLVLAALSRDPRTRIQTAGEFRSELEAVAALVGIRPSAREVADWMVRYAQPEDSWARARATPLPDAATASMRLPLAAPRRSSTPPPYESVASEVWAEPPGQAVSQASPTPNPVEPVTLPPPPRRSRAPLLVLLGLLMIAGSLGAYYFLYMRPAPPVAAATAALRFEIQPEGAIISIGGKEVSRRSPFEAELEPGVYSIEVHREGYKPWKNSVTLRAGDRQTIGFALERGIAQVTVESEPAGLLIELDGKLTAARTPARLDVSAGAHRIRITNDAGEVWSQEFTAAADGVYTFTAPLDPEVAKKSKRDEKRTQPAPAAANTRRPAPARVATVEKPQSKEEPAAPDAGSAAPVPAPAPPPVAPAPVPVAPTPAPAPAPPKSTRVPMVSATTVTKLSGQIPSFQVRGNVSGDVLVKLCINEQGAVTSAKAMKAPAEITAELEGALKSWRYRPYRNKDGQPSPACFPFGFRVIVKQ